MVFEIFHEHNKDDNIHRHNVCEAYIISKSKVIMAKIEKYVQGFVFLLLFIYLGQVILGNGRGRRGGVRISVSS